MVLLRRRFVVIFLCLLLANFTSGKKFDVQTCPEAKQAGNAGLIAMAVLIAFSVIFAILVIVASIMVMAKLSEKTREAETHLHQVMDATLTVLHPESVFGEINCVAEEAQQQFKKKEPGNGPDTKTENEVKSPAKKD